MAEKRVYIVTSGSYSDYGINAVFSTRLAAKEYILAHREPSESDRHLMDNDDEWDGRYRIEVWPFDKPLERQWWDVRMEYATGNGARAVERTMKPAPKTEEELVGRVYNHVSFGPSPARFAVSVQNRSLIGAIKAGNEKRTQFIAMNGGIIG